MSELDIMLVVGAEGGHRARYFGAANGPYRQRPAHSYLKRLEEKGYLACRKEGKTNRYTPLVERAGLSPPGGRAILGKEEVCEAASTTL